ncbi:MAG: prolipoprotein diacylglyceryl transferase [Dermatophilaceae bacterium]
MLPVLFTIFGVPIQSYGVSKALAAVVAGWLLARLFVRRGLNPDDAYTMTIAGTVWGFVGAKAYYLLEHLPNLSWHNLGSSGFTWYGGFLAGVAAVVVVARRRRIPLVLVAGLAAAPLSVAYGIGRLGCLLAGDGTYGRPSTLPWAMAFPNGMVPTTIPVQPTQLYEALVAFALAGALWWVQDRFQPVMAVVTYLVVSGIARFLIEFARDNALTPLGLTQPQLWSAVLAAAGVVLAVRSRQRDPRLATGMPSVTTKEDRFRNTP